MYSFEYDLSGHDQSVNCLAFSPDGGYLASGDDSGCLFVWKVPFGEKQDTYHFSDSITAILWLPDSLMLFVGLANCEVHLISVVSTPPSYSTTLKLTLHHRSMHKARHWIFRFPDIRTYQRTGEICFRSPRLLVPAHAPIVPSK